MVMHRNTKYRQLLTWFFVASLLLNVQSTFACTMMPDMPDLYLFYTEGIITAQSFARG